MAALRLYLWLIELYAELALGTWELGFLYLRVVTEGRRLPGPHIHITLERVTER